jgi:signal transduction histidine kinase
VNSVVDDLDQTSTDIRAVIFSLQARGKGPPGLRSYVMDVVDQMTEAHGMSSSMQLADRLDQEVPGEIGEHLLYALREALSNAARHGRASHVDVSVHMDGKLSLRVLDNGTGITPGPRRSGLANLARRAEPYGGTLMVGPASGGGTELCWQVAPALGGPGAGLTAGPGQRACSRGPRSSNTRAAYAAAWVRRSMPSLANNADT